MFDIFKSKSQTFSWIVLILFTSAFLFINFPFVVPLALAGIFALGLNDLIQRLSSKFKIRRNLCIALTLFAGLALFWVPISLAIYRIVVNISDPQAMGSDQIVSQIHKLKDFLLEWLQKISEWTGTDLAGPARAMMENILRKTGEIILNFSTQLLGQLPAIFLASFVFVIVLAVLLVKASSVKSVVIKYTPFSQTTTESLVKVFKSSCSITLFSTLVVGMIQASIIGVGSLIFGEGDFWLVLTVTFFVSFIPVIGAAPVGFLLAVLAFIGGRIGPGIGLTVVGIIAGSIDNILKPFILGKDFDINPVIGFTSVVGAIIMMGLPGLILGPVIMNLFVGITPLLLKEQEIGSNGEGEVP
ncbi:AI-2E family transporter [Bdellovibrio sp. 22V]|uniref:AI-2E family transporter n=1 Tax=Bdellovibrio TaxID=958 RepID=UPI0025427D70|nr:AI-2E family transporter [Bdellovibrio sp. 22V]WII71165.1 AI-2E family transporter [Bdellovibrio sp. 22V]